MKDPFPRGEKHLPRLERGVYHGRTYVHWTLTIQDRRTGWMIPAFLYKFRELLTHTAFRYALVCPIYCLMPDHIHMAWIGISEQTDQRTAMRFFRRQLGGPLSKLGFSFQHQPYDHVLRDNERAESAFESLVEYIARNPERKGLVPVDRFREYKFTGSLVPGYPELDLRQHDFWMRFWRTYAFLKKHGLFRACNEQK